MVFAHRQFNITFSAVGFLWLAALFLLRIVRCCLYYLYHVATPGQAEKDDIPAWCKLFFKQALSVCVFYTLYFDDKLAGKE